MKGSLRSATRTRRREPSVLCFDADPIIHCGPNALLAAEVSLGRLDRDVSEQELDLLQFAARRVAQPSTCPPEIGGASLSMPALRAYSRTTCQTAFSVKLSPQAFPFLLTRRNSLPAVNPAAWSQSSSNALTQPGIGMVLV